MVRLSIVCPEKPDLKILHLKEKAFAKITLNVIFITKYSNPKM